MKVIIVRKGRKLLEVIPPKDSDQFYMIRIDNQLIEKDKLVKKKCKEDYVYEYEQDGYKLIIDVCENINKGWYFLWDIINPNCEYVYSLGTTNLLDYLDGKIECHDIFIKKWGSKTKIDEG